jgi:glucose-6-phosphate dehydrogenase assembly protein OpcA
MSSVDVTPERILKELSELWTLLGKQEANGVLRACAMTLIVAAGEDEDEAIVGEGLAGLMQEHPSRAIVLRVPRNEDAPLSARVTPQCWMPFGRRQQICCEQIEIWAPQTVLEDVPRLVLGLMAPDLPVVLVCRSPRLFLMPAFAPMIRLAGKVIVDSRDHDPSWNVLEELGKWNAEGGLVSDLAWTATTRWRESISHAFDDPGLQGKWNRIQQVSISLGPGSNIAEACYLAAWLESSLSSGIHLHLTHAPSSSDTLTVRLGGEDLQLRFVQGEGSCLRLAWDSVATSVSFAVLSDWDLLREELGILDRDGTFDRVLPRTIALARG